MHFPVGNADERGDIAVQIQPGVHLDSGFALAKLGPREQRQAQIDGRGIQRIETVRQVHADRIVGVEWPGDADQHLREIGVDAPVVALVGVSQRGARYPAAKSHVIQLAVHRAKARLDVAQALPVSQLRECHRQKLVSTREASWVGVTTIKGYAFLELLARSMCEQLREDSAAGVHPPLFRSGDSPSSGRKGYQDFKSFQRSVTASHWCKEIYCVTPKNSRTLVYSGDAFDARALRGASRRGPNLG